ncbi:MAG: acyl-ACP desaturase [Elusimicrobia bacterium]|nr:acyl-ACP desaturase [Elusimicrobiota bacterium]
MNQTQHLQKQANRFEIVQSMDSFVQDHIHDLLKPIHTNWQPSSFLPDLREENWTKEIQNFRNMAQGLSDELLTALVGNMITEEALPSYQTWLNNLAGVKDYSGADNHGWAQWIRGWSAEENRHGDLLNKYLYLCGRVDMHAVETTIQYLIRNGFDPQTENDPYLGFVYTSFQERATKISHRNVASLAAKAGDENLHEICGLIAGDEARHEKAYTLFMKKVFEIDPNGAVIAFAKLMKKRVAMPAKLMSDGKNKNLFNQYSLIAQSIGVYTIHDYASIIQHLIESWNVKHLKGLSVAAIESQDYLLSLPDRYYKLAERTKPQKEKIELSWILKYKHPRIYSTQ